MTYPSAEERARIIARRKELRTELIAILAVGDLRRSKKKLDKLAHQYDQAEVERVLDGLQKIFERDPDGDITWLYRDYAAYYRRFGGQRPWLSLAEFTTAQEEFGALYARKELGPSLAPAESQRLAELADWLFKEAELWEDLVPEDPPAVLPDVEVPPVPAKPAQLDRVYIQRCPTDGFPMVKIKDRLECVAEYLNRYIGRQAVADVVRRGETTCLVFENGYELPLLCSCCDGPLLYTDIEPVRRDMRGRRLESMVTSIETFEDGRQVEALVLEFSKKSLLSRGVDVTVSFNVAAQLHVRSGPGKPGPAKRQPARAKRRKRKK